MLDMPSADFPRKRTDLTQEVVANCLVAFVRLWKRGKADVAFAAPLAMFAVRQVCAGRHVGTKLNVHDVSSPYAQLAKGIRLQRLDHYDGNSEEWREIVVADHRAMAADVARVRIDFHAWLQILSNRDRRIARLLAGGEATHAVAKRFRLTAGRVSQLRRELADSWLSFQGDKPLPERGGHDVV